MRLIFHEQLKAFWALDSRLNRLLIHHRKVAHKKGAHFDVPGPIPAAKDLFWRLPLCGRNYVPLANHVHELHCHLSIRLYRQLERGGIVFNGGDLDNRLKPLFDALRIPHAATEIPRNERVVPPTDPARWEPFFCLLDNDNTITKLSIQSLKLLTPVPSGVRRPENYAEIDIDASITPASAIAGNIDMLFD